MVRASFVPPPPIRELRELTRYRKTQSDARAAEIQRLEKVLQDAGIKLTSVASRVLTQSGRAMIEALIAGERDGARLAELAKGKMRPKIPALTEALSGHFGSHHAVACQRILGHLDFLDESIAALSEQINARTAAFPAVYTLLLPVPGLDRLTIDVIIAETGADMSRFPTPGDLASWVGLCPGSHESAGKHRRVGTTKGNPWLRRALIEFARAAARTKGSYFGAQYRQVAHRRGPNKAAVAVAHSLIELVWHLLSTGELSRTSAMTTSPPAETRAASPPSRRAARRARLHRNPRNSTSHRRISTSTSAPVQSRPSRPSRSCTPLFASHDS
jgi:transposase